jgi:hypothetical protein
VNLFTGYTKEIWVHELVNHDARRYDSVPQELQIDAVMKSAAHVHASICALDASKGGVMYASPKTPGHVSHEYCI